MSAFGGKADIGKRGGNVRFSIWPFEVNHHCSVDVAHGLALLVGIDTKASALMTSRA
jgi:hypothetical protein